MKQVILITGTPCVGKTTISKQLAAELGAKYINLTEYAKTYGLTLKEDTKRKTTIINEKAMRQQLSETITSEQPDLVIDGHFAAAIVPENFTSHVFVLRRNPKELKTFMQKCGFTESKLYENLGAEILDNCLIEALQYQQGKVYELDITGRSVQNVVVEIVDILNSSKKSRSGFVDWLGLLESEGVLDDYLRI